MSAKKPTNKRLNKNRRIYLSPYWVDPDIFDEKHYDILRAALEESPYLTLDRVMSLNISTEWKVNILLSEELFTKNQLFGLALSFAERVLPVFEEHEPDNTAPRRCLSIMQHHAEGKTTDKEVYEIANEVDEILLAMEGTVGFDHYAAQSAFSILSLTYCAKSKNFESEIADIAEYAQKAADLCKQAYGETFLLDEVRSPDSSPALGSRKEAEWQLERILEVFNGE